VIGDHKSFINDCCFEPIHGNEVASVGGNISLCSKFGKKILFHDKIYFMKNVHEIVKHYHVDVKV